MLDDKTVSKPTTVIGFDPGTRWTGVAVGQTLTCQATPLTAIRVIDNQPDWNKISTIINEWHPQLLVIGLPLDMQGNPQPMTKKARKFSRQLTEKFNLPCELVDERLTTREAWLLAIESGKRRGKKEIDSIAAALITESWLSQVTSVWPGHQIC
jgi:putative holliday junction resolvase